MKGFGTLLLWAVATGAKDERQPWPLPANILFPYKASRNCPKDKPTECRNCKDHCTSCSDTDKKCPDCAYIPYSGDKPIECVSLEDGTNKEICSCQCPKDVAACPDRTQGCTGNRCHCEEYHTWEKIDPEKDCTSNGNCGGGSCFSKKCYQCRKCDNGKRTSTKEPGCVPCKTGDKCNCPATTKGTEVYWVKDSACTKDADCAGFGSCVGTCAADSKTQCTEDSACKDLTNKKCNKTPGKCVVGGCKTDDDCKQRKAKCVSNKCTPTTTTLSKCYLCPKGTKACPEKTTACSEESACVPCETGDKCGCEVKLTWSWNSDKTKGRCCAAGEKWSWNTDTKVAECAACVKTDTKCNCPGKQIWKGTKCKCESGKTWSCAGKDTGSDAVTCDPTELGVCCAKGKKSDKKGETCIDCKKGDKCDCPAEQKWDVVKCMCPTGKTLKGKNCADCVEGDECNCPDTQTWVGGKCECPKGQILNQRKKCVTPDSQKTAIPFRWLGVVLVLSAAAALLGRRSLPGKGAVDITCEVTSV